jgi:hypothetical protein
MSKMRYYNCMDFKTHFGALGADQNWIRQYLDFVAFAKSPEGRSHRHHILPRSMFPEFESFKDHSWNCKRLTPSDHFVAHYYLYRALPKHPVAYLSFLKMASVERLNALAQRNYEGLLVREMSLEYERIRSGAASLDGWLHIYKGKSHTVVSAAELEVRLADGWTQTAPRRQWVHRGEESYRVAVGEVQSYLDRGFTLGRAQFHTNESRKITSSKSVLQHERERVQPNAYSYLPRGNQHHRKNGCPEEVAAKIGKTLAGRKLAPEHAAKVRVAAKDKHWKWSPEARKRLSEQRKGTGNNRFGKQGYWAGKIRPESTRRKMSASHKTRIASNISI